MLFLSRMIRILPVMLTLTSIIALSMTPISANSQSKIMNHDSELSTMNIVATALSRQKAKPTPQAKPSPKPRITETTTYPSETSQVIKNTEATSTTSSLPESSAAVVPTSPTTTAIQKITPETNRETTPETSKATTRATTAETTQAVTEETVSALPAGNTYYVSSAGSDSNAGSATAPFRTIQQAISHVPSGSTIIVCAGTYNEKLSISGRSGLTICNNSGDRPVLSGSGFSSGYLVDITSSQNISVSGFEVCDFKGKNLEGIIIRDASQNIEISSCKFHDIATTLSKGNAHVILASGDSNTPLTNIVIKNNEIYQCTTGWSESVTMEGNVDGFAITGNKIHDVTNIAIDATGFYDSGCTIASMNQARNGRIAHNLVYNLHCSYAACAGIYVDGGRDIIIEKNTIHNSMFGIEVGCENPCDEYNPSVRAKVSGITVRYNTVYNNSEIGISIGGYEGTKTGQVINSRIYNNTTYHNQCELNLNYCDSISLTKNIFCSASGGNLIYNEPANNVTGLIMNNNLYYAESGTGEFELNGQYADSLSAWQTISGQDTDSIFADPLFVNKAVYDFNLQPDSPAIELGAH
jgi:hypothetical protein